MTDVVRALQAHLTLYRGVTREFRVAFFENLGGGTVLGQPTYTPIQGPAEDWTTHPLLIGALAPAAGLLGDDEPVQLGVTWYTQSPADITLVITAENIEAALALVGDRQDRRLVYTVKARRSTNPANDEVLLLHGFATVIQTALTPDLSPL